MITKLILPDGSILSSGAADQAAILTFSHTQSVTAGQELEPGACCAAMIRVEILGDSGLNSGMELEVYRDHKLLGLFTVHTVEKSGPIRTVTAYDRMSRLDKDLTDWLRKRTDWPVSLADLSREICESCQLELITPPPLTDRVPQFAASFVTGRQLLQWAAQACGCFCRVNSYGQVEFAWYRENPVEVPYYYMGTLRFSDYQVTPVAQVRLQQSSADVGVVWPQVTEQVNTLLIRGNPMLAAETTDQTEPVARYLYDRFSAVSYTPCTVSVPEETDISAGDIVTVEGKRVYVMTATLERGRRHLSCTGSKLRGDSSTVYISNKALSGRVLELDTKIDGLTAENRDSAGKLSRLSMTVDGLTATVSAQLSREQQRLTKLEQTAESLSLQIKNSAGQVVTETGYTFNDEGLRIARSGTEMENRLDHSGMYVCRAGETILQANNRGVVAADVRVHNYLHVGSHARFEDLAGRTACYYIEGERT